MKYRCKFLLVFLLLYFFAIPGAFALTVDDVAKEFICNCGCKKLLNVCDMECGEKLRALIGQKIQDGWSKQQITNYMIKNYGEKVLSAPTKKGFNLTAWITPFLAISIAGLIIYFVIQEWVSRRQEIFIEEKETRKVIRKLEDKYSERLKKELETFE